MMVDGSKGGSDVLAKKENAFAKMGVAEKFALKI